MKRIEITYFVGVYRFVCVCENSDEAYDALTTLAADCSVGHNFDADKIAEVLADMVGGETVGYYTKTYQFRVLDDESEV